MPSLPTLRHVLPALVLGLIASLAPVVLTVVEPPRAEATSTYLCTGYSACKDAGYSDDGYGAHNDTMYWRMYSGHNCTNYVAYRMIRAGLPTERPWGGTGMAYNWGFANASITDHTPAVGAVAWWNRNVVGAGSSGHVAYVEKVISKDEIIISEDSWSGDFHWRRLYNTGAGWPSGFVHFRDRATMVNKTAPKISGTPQVGEPLVSDTGAWKPKPSKYAFQWFASGTVIKGATKRSFTPTADQVKQKLTVSVTGAKSGAPAVVATSAPTAPVARGELVGLTPPVLAGDPVVGQDLTATRGTWSRRTDSRTYKWRAGPDVVARTDEPLLTLTPEMVGKRISVFEVGRRAGFHRGYNRSDFSASVLRGVVAPGAPFEVSGTPARGETLSVEPGTVTPASAALTYTWLRDGVAVPGATGTTYQLSDDDVGSTITLQVVASKPDYRSLVQTLSFGGLVTTQPDLAVHTHGKKRAARVRLQLSAPGVESPGGAVTISVGQKATVTRTIVDGAVTVIVDGLTPGRHPVRVDYAGTREIQPTRTASHVTVRR